jgi:hypothetical protein
MEEEWLSRRISICRKKKAQKLRGKVGWNEAQLNMATITPRTVGYLGKA